MENFLVRVALVSGKFEDYGASKRLFFRKINQLALVFLAPSLNHGKQKNFSLPLENLVGKFYP
jgi:hypothetical protein